MIGKTQTNCKINAKSNFDSECESNCQGRTVLEQFLPREHEDQLNIYPRLRVVHAMKSFALVHVLDEGDQGCL